MGGFDGWNGGTSSSKQVDTDETDSGLSTHSPPSKHDRLDDGEHFKQVLQTNLLQNFSKSHRNFIDFSVCCDQKIFKNREITEHYF